MCTTDDQEEYEIFLQGKRVHEKGGMASCCKIAAKSNGEPCCDLVGNAGFGHFVKMVRNGIEYGDMHLIDVAYHLLIKAVELNYDQMTEVMDDWNMGELETFLIGITANILVHHLPLLPLKLSFKTRDSLSDV
ncbi:unnamed protein product [Caenorhabditis nigoni]